MLRYFLVFILFPVSVEAQRKMEIDLFGGMSNYQGDLQAHFFTFQESSPAAAFNLKIGLTNKLFIRTGLSFGALRAHDSKNSEINKPRNLNFLTALQEYNAGLEYRFFDPEYTRITPYLFAGGGVFHFNSYTYYMGGGTPQRVQLQPLSTEGQGLSMYPDRIPYKLTQVCLPYGVGIKYQVNCNLNIGLELRHTKTFTDYIDDVSMTYVNQDALRAARGQIAVDLAWRGDEFNGRPYPATDTQRGNAKQKDSYYFAGITVGLRLRDCNNGSFSLGGLFNGVNSLFKRNNGDNWNVLRQVRCPDN